MNMFRVFLEQNIAALALRQGAQLGKISALKQNGASDKGIWVIFEPMPETEDLPFCFFLPFCRGWLFVAKALCHGFYRLPAQQGLIPGQEHAAEQPRHLLKERCQPQPHGIVAPGQAVQQHRNAVFFAQGFHFGRAGHHDAGGKHLCIRCGKSTAEHGLTAKFRQKLVGAKAAAQAGCHDHTPCSKLVFHSCILRPLTKSFREHYNASCNSNAICAKIKEAIKKERNLQL